MNDPPAPSPKRTPPAKGAGPRRIESVHLEGFRSLAEVTFRPNPGVTVLIGPNGAGKSNLVRFFEMLRAMFRERNVGLFVGVKGGAEDQLFRGSEQTPRMQATIRTTNGEGAGEYAFAFTPDEQDLFRFAEERFRDARTDSGGPGPWTDLGSGHREAELISAGRGPEKRDDKPTAKAIGEVLEDIGSYHFDHTSGLSPLKRRRDVEDSFRLHPDGGNLAAVLYRMEREDPDRYRTIGSRIRGVLPNFEDFSIDDEFGTLFLGWKAAGSDKRIGAHLTSDGSLRFFALTTLLHLWPEALPAVLLLDEPELGLHPSAIARVGGAIRSAAATRQVIVATQSPLLVDEFSLDEIQVFDLRDGRTRIRAVEPDEYREWLEEYSTGELWQKNLLGGRP